MPKVKISEYSATANSNTDVASINIDEGCAPSGINNAIRAIMGHLKDFQQGTNGDPFNGPVNGTVGATTPSTGAFTTLSATGNVTLGDASTDTLNVGNGGLIKDASGNVGVGVTPSAWFSSNKTMQVGSTGALSNYTNGSNIQTFLSNNVYWNAAGTISYLTTNTATSYTQDNGTHKFYVAPSGTAGNAITFTQAMTLDASGNLGIGTTSPSKRLHVIGDEIRFSNSTNASYYGYIQHDAASTGANIYDSVDSGGHIFKTSGTERARIDSSGNLLVGTTSANASAHHVLQYSDTAKFAAAVVNSSASTSALGLYVNYSLLTPNGTGSEFIYCADFTALRMSVRSNGGIANYSANNVNLSDRREKTNFAPSKSYLDVICAIPVQTFNYIDQNMEDDGGLTLGVVAQDVQAVAPEMVMESNWGTKEEPKMRLSIYQTDLQYALMKCIQEMKSIIDDQAARIATLEAK